MPLLLGALLTTLDVLIILVLRNSKLALLEACVAALLGVVALCLGGELLFAPPSPAGLAAWLLPALPPDSLYVAIGILGAALMPHNFYLQFCERRFTSKTFQDLQAMSPLAGASFAALCGAGAAFVAWISFVPLRAVGATVSGPRRSGRLRY